MAYLWISHFAMVLRCFDWNTHVFEELVEKLKLHIDPLRPGDKVRLITRPADGLSIPSWKAFPILTASKLANSLTTSVIGGKRDVQWWSDHFSECQTEAPWRYWPINGALVLHFFQQRSESHLTPRYQASPCPLLFLSFVLFWSVLWSMINVLLPAENPLWSLSLNLTAANAIALCKHFKQ